MTMQRPLPSPSPPPSHTHARTDTFLISLSPLPPTIRLRVHTAVAGIVLGAALLCCLLFGVYRYMRRQSRDQARMIDEVEAALTQDLSLEHLSRCVRS